MGSIFFSYICIVNLKIRNMITLYKTKIMDILLNMSKDEIMKLVKFESNTQKYRNEEDILNDLLGSRYRGLTLITLDEEINGYKFYTTNEIEGVVVIKDDKLICILDEYEAGNIIYFEGIVIVPGRNSISIFSTITGTKEIKDIR